MADAVAADEFAALLAPFAPFEALPVLAVAVSGGRDSLGLALLAHQWAQARDGRVLALIVEEAVVQDGYMNALTDGFGAAV